MLLCLHDALDRFLVLEEDNIGVAVAVTVADQDSPENSFCFCIERFSSGLEQPPRVVCQTNRSNGAPNTYRVRSEMSFVGPVP